MCQIVVINSSKKLNRSFLYIQHLQNGDGVTQELYEYAKMLIEKYKDEIEKISIL
jgi:hypothetical protein